jgi:steroid 5-alpha reductase family enzyme
MQRIHRFSASHDDPACTNAPCFRFPLKLAFFWTLQGLWAWICLLPVTASHALGPRRLSTATLGGLALFAGGLLLESTADYQKFVWKSDPANRGKFMGPVGVYAYSQYPNYFAEMVIWSGLTLAAGPAVLRTCPWVLASPLFTITLLMFISGIPLLEKHNAERFGNDPAYRAYKAATSLLIPWFPKQAVS